MHSKPGADQIAIGFDRLDQQVFHCHRRHTVLVCKSSSVTPASCSCARISSAREKSPASRAAFRLVIHSSTSWSAILNACSDSQRNQVCFGTWSERLCFYFSHQFLALLLFFGAYRYGVMAPFVPMATCDSFQREPHTTHGTVFTQTFYGVH